MVKLRVLFVLFIVLCGFGCDSLRDVETSRNSPKMLSVPQGNDGFSFMVFGDRTGSNKESIEVLKDAVDRANRMGPEFVYTVGDLIHGYYGSKDWFESADEFGGVMEKLEMPWYPVAGNHDVYWYRDTKDRPKGHHESEYETYFGPLWYAFEYNNCWFVTLYSDEGKPGTSKKGFLDPEMQKMSPEQFGWLEGVLNKAKNADHIFLFMHHPRWITETYGGDWGKVHSLLKEAGNVSAVFCGHFHTTCHSEKDSIDYYIMGTTGGSISEYSLDPNHLAHWVNVTDDGYDVSTVALDSFIDPKTRKIETDIVVAKQDWATDSKETIVEWELSTEGLEFETGLFIARLKINDAKKNKRGIDLIFLDENKNEIERDKKIKRKGVLLPAYYEIEPGKKYFLQLADRDAEGKDEYPGKTGEIEIIRRYYFKTE